MACFTHCLLYRTFHWQIYVRRTLYYNFAKPIVFLGVVVTTVQWLTYSKDYALSALSNLNVQNYDSIHLIVVIQMKIMQLCYMDWVD